jgi:hypothetical protein
MPSFLRAPTVDALNHAVLDHAPVSFEQYAEQRIEDAAVPYRGAARLRGFPTSRGRGLSPTAVDPKPSMVTSFARTRITVPVPDPTSFGDLADEVRAVDDQIADDVPLGSPR